MAFFGQAGGAPPGAARNSLSQYPPKGTGFAATKPPVPPPGGYRYGAMPKPPQYGRNPGSIPPVGAPTMPPGVVPAGGATTGQDQIGGLQGVPAGATLDSLTPDQRQRQLERTMRQDQRAINRTGINDPYTGGAMDTAPPAAADPTGANRPGMEYRQDRRQAARQTGLDAPAMAEGADGPNQQWRADRRQAERQGLISQDAGGGFDPTAAGDATGANRAGMDWRAQRRAAKEDGSYVPDTGANRDGMQYRQDRRQAARRAANMPPAKPGQPPAM